MILPPTTPDPLASLLPPRLFRVSHFIDKHENGLFSFDRVSSFSHSFSSRCFTLLRYCVLLPSYPFVLESVVESLCLNVGIVLTSCSVHPITRSSFTGSPISIPRVHPPSQTPTKPRNLLPITMMVKPTLQFIQGTDEMTIPDVKLTRSRDGSNGMALFNFDQPSVFDSSGEVGEITGLYMIDEEGVIQSTDVNARFVNGKPEGIVAKHVMRTPKEWDRFMRFMERYSDQNGLQFVKKQ
ncbi:hypothetical protein F2Q70_00034441 [Brassica cretica]|uniref:Photosystem II reaction center Psb28 protein n=1 Tax=Brassica cretica TaxID=69181 RepID=A0A8S9G814_BRACR|nr:hypothetical protein F2Q68_00029324 [Brassica cretica]KAF2586248.1 hypothetical protein F2Q70_00034441 [Brassica cretica]